MVPGDTMEIAAPEETIVLTVPAIAVAIYKDADTITLQGTPGLAGTLSLLHNGVRRYESYAASRVRLGDDGRLDIPLRGIYEIWNNTRASFCVALPEGDSACTTAYASGLTVNATYNMASGYAAPNSDVLLTVKRGTIPRGSALVRADGVGAFSTRAFCQAGVPVDIAAGDQVVLQPATTLSVQGVSAQLDTATHTLSGIGPTGQTLWVRFYPQRDPPGGWLGSDGQELYPCQIDCQPLPPAAPTGNTIHGQAILVAATGHFSITHPSLQAGDYAIITYEDQVGNLLQYVARSTSGTDLSVALTDVSEVAVIPGIHAALDLESDTLYGVGPANAQLDVKFVFHDSRVPPTSVDGGSGSGGGLCAIACQSLHPTNSRSYGRNIIQTSAEGQFSVQTAEYYTFTPAGERVTRRWDLAAGDYAIIRYEDARGNLYVYIVSSTSANDLQVAFQQVDTQLAVPYLTGSLNLESNTLMVSGVPGTRIQSRFVMHQDSGSLTCPPARWPIQEPDSLCSLWCESLQTDIQYIFGGAAQIGATGKVMIPARADLQAGDYAVITYEDEQGNFSQMIVHSTSGAELNAAATTILPSVDAWQTLVLTWTVSGGVNHDVSRLYWDTSAHSCDRNYVYVVEGMQSHQNSGGGGGGGGGNLNTVTTPTISTYTATLVVPNAEALYLRPYAEIDGHQVWAVQETVISINPPPPGADAYEPDDTCVQAHPILTDGTAQQRTFHQYADEDWVWFDVISNTTYTVFASQTGPQADVELQLYDVCEATPVYTATNPLGSDARLVFTAPVSGRYYIRVYNYDPNAYGEGAYYQLAVRAERPRGLAIIVSGRLRMGDGLQANINWATNRAYLTFLHRGYAREDIHYLNVWPNQDVDGNGLQDDIVGMPTVTAIQAAIETWAVERGVGPGVPLYIYLMDHGKVDRFYADVNQVVTAEQLNAWLTALETATGADEITVIMDACNSGSFIDQYIDPAYPVWGLGQISAPNRVIISSTSSWWPAWPTSQGILFSDAFWDGMREGRSVADSFARGQAAVDEAGYANCTSPLQFNCQEPWLDDNGNGIPNDPTDGLLAQQRGLLAPLGWEVPEIATVSISPVAAGDIATITAQIYDDGELALVEAQIIPPRYTPTLPDDGSLPVLEVPTITLQASGGITYTGVYTGFTTPGIYRVVVYAWDMEGLTALPRGVDVSSIGRRIYLPLILRPGE